MKQDVGYYLHQEGPNLGKHRVPCVPCYLRSSDAQFGTPYPRSAGFDTDIGAFIESSFVLSIEGSMARLVINDDITSGRALTPGKVLQLGGFTIGARLAIKPAAAPTIAKHHLRISLKHSEKMDPADVLSLNELQDRIAALGV